MIIEVRHSANIGNTPAALANGELALNAADQLLYYKHANGSILALADGATLGIDFYARIRSNAAFTKANGTLIVAQLSSNINQIPANTNTYKVTYNTQDILTSASHTVGNSRVTVLSNGTYMIVVGGQIARTSGTNATDYTDFWIRKNGIDVPRSATRSVLMNTMSPASSAFSPVINNFPLNLTANDYIEIIQAVRTSGTGMGLTRAAALTGGPTLPSITLTIIKIAN